MKHWPEPNWRNPYAPKQVAEKLALLIGTGISQAQAARLGARPPAPPALEVLDSSYRDEHVMVDG